MKRFLLMLVVFLLALTPIGLAHPGGLDKNGGHTCRTNCTQYGLKDGEYHYHNSDGSIRRQTSGSTQSNSATLSVYVNGVKQSYDQPPVLSNGRTLVPLRGIFETLGASVQYDSKTQTIDATKGSTKIRLKIGSKTTKVGDKPVTLDVPAQTKNGRTLVPLRFVGEALGATVQYDSANKRIDITSQVETAQGKINAVVTKVVDGDTIKVKFDNKEETVRLLLIDTPETVHPSQPVQPFGKEASDFAKSLMPEGSIVQLELDVGERDKYQRLLAYVWVDGQMVNEMLLEKGLARVAYVYAPNTRHVDKFNEIQKKAQQQAIGIWSIENYVTQDGFNS